MKQVVFGLPKFNGQKAQICEAFQLVKQHRLPFPNEHNRTQNTLDLIYSYVCVPAQNGSLGGSRYFVSFIEDYSRHTWIYLIEKKSFFGIPKLVAESAFPSITKENEFRTAAIVFGDHPSAQGRMVHTQKSTTSHNSAFLQSKAPVGFKVLGAYSTTY